MVRACGKNREEILIKRVYRVTIGDNRGEGKRMDEMKESLMWKCSLQGREHCWIEPGKIVHECKIL